jgi:hypothetical protein
MDQEWEIKVYDPVGAADVWSVTADGTGSQDVTLGTPRQYLDFEFKSKANRQMPPDRELFFGEVSNVVMYSETGNIYLEEIAKDIRAQVSNLNSDETNIDSNSLSLVPFLTNGPETTASILQRAATYGDASFNQWDAYLLPSDDAASPDGKPVLAVEQYPALTDYDYSIRVDEENVLPPLEIDQDVDDIVNWVSVVYRNDENNRKVVITPDDDANLKDTDSIAAWGERHLPRPLNAGQATVAMAKNLARRVLNARKDPRFYVSGPIRVVGYIRAKDGQQVPCSKIRAGKRIRIENFLEDLAGTTDAGLTFIITSTRYDDSRETCLISTGIPDELSAFLAQRTLLEDRLIIDGSAAHDHFVGGGGVVKS